MSSTNLFSITEFYAVLAIDIQDDLNATASELTNRCNLSDKVHHICGDFLKVGVA